MNKYSLASSSWNESELRAIQNVIDSDIFTMGTNVLEYENQFAKFFGSKYSVMVNSGSSANLLMVASLFFTQNKSIKLSRGDEIIVPAVSWSTSYFPLQQYGLKLKFVDINIDTLNIDLNKLRNAITKKTKAILAVNLLGNPNDFTEIFEIIKNRNIVVIEDNCESMGAIFSKKYTGTFGIMGSFSSFFSHHISTMEGGCIVTNDDELYHILLTIRAHGWTRNLPNKNHVTGVKSEDWFEESFKFVLPGYNVRPLEMSGAIGIEQLKKLPEFLLQRRQNAFFFIHKFQNHPWLKIQKETGQSSWFGFSLILSKESPISRKELIAKLRENSIECRPIVSGNFLKNKDVLKYFDYEISGSFENSEYLDINGLFVGNHQIDISENIEHLYSLISTL